MTSPDTLRLFIAINLPEEVKVELARLQQALEDTEEIRWTPVQQIHLTLKFLGEVDSASVNDLKAALQRASAGVKPFVLEAVGVGAFPNLRRPRVLWAGLEGDLGSLKALQERIQHETTAWGRPDDKPFSAHLTIGRVKEGRTPDLRAWSARTATMRFGSWQATQIHLMRSVLSPGGATHSEVAVIDLPGLN